MSSDSKWKDTRTREIACPNCGTKLDAAASAEGYTPKPGDCTICIRCQFIFIFTDDMGLRSPSTQDLAMLPLDVITRYQRAISAVRSMPA